LFCDTPEAKPDRSVAAEAEAGKHRLTVEVQEVSAGTINTATPVVPVHAGVAKRAIAAVAAACGGEEESIAGGFVGKAVSVNAIFGSPFARYVSFVC